MTDPYETVRLGVLQMLEKGPQTYQTLSSNYPFSFLDNVLNDLCHDNEVGYDYKGSVYHMLSAKKPATATTSVGSKLVVEIDEEAPLHLVKIGDLQVGETFSFQVGRSPKNVYMVLREDEFSRTHCCVRTVLLTTGSTYYEKVDRSVRRRACVLKVAP